MDDSLCSLSAAGAWPATPWSLVRRARGGDGAGMRCRRSLHALASLYYEPVWAFFRRALRVPEDAAADVTQDFFTKLLEGAFLDGLRHETSFRGYIRVACRRHCSRWWAAEVRTRGRLRPLDEAGAAVAAAGASPSVAALEAAFDEELRRFYIVEARESLRRDLVGRGKLDALAIFEARTLYEGERPEKYRELAERLGLQLYDVRNHLFAARRIFRHHLLRLAAERADDPRDELRGLGLLGLIE